MTEEEMIANPRWFIDRHGPYQDPHLSGIDKVAHDLWVETTSWNLTRFDFIRLSFFHGCIKNGSDGSGPVNGSEDFPYDVVYVSEGGYITRNTVSHFLDTYGSFTYGFNKAYKYFSNNPHDLDIR